VTRLDDPAFESRKKQETFLIFKKSILALLGPISLLLFNGHKEERGLFLRGLSGRGVKLITHLYLVPTVKMSTAVSLVPHMSS
jgi:hypothetical protein